MDRARLGELCRMVRGGFRLVPPPAVNDNFLVARKGIEFTCISCRRHVYSALHYGLQNICMPCKAMGGAEVRKLVAEGWL